MNSSLAEVPPELVTEWSEKNLPLKPDEVNAKSRKNVRWRCSKCGNEWKSYRKSIGKKLGERIEKSKTIDYVVYGRYNLFEVANCTQKNGKCIFKNRAKVFNNMSLQSMK